MAKRPPPAINRLRGRTPGPRLPGRRGLAPGAAATRTGGAHRPSRLWRPGTFTRTTGHLRYGHDRSILPNRFSVYRLLDECGLLCGYRMLGGRSLLTLTQLTPRQRRRHDRRRRNGSLTCLWDKSQQGEPGIRAQLISAAGVGRPVKRLHGLPAPSVSVRRGAIMTHGEPHRGHD